MATLRVDNPATGEIAAEVEMLPASSLDRLLERAAAASREIAACDVDQRVALCERVLSWFESNGDRVARDLTAQMGKPIGEARAEIRTMIDRARHMMSIAAEQLATEALPDGPGLERYIERVPVGTVLDIAAWNYPLLIPVNVVVPAVLAGNAVVLKHSSRTPLCAAHFADAFAGAGAPAGLVAAVVTDHDTSAALIARREIGYVAFTGSVRGGEEVSRAAAGRPIEVGLELGGNDPAYVRADADLDFAVENVAEGAFYNAGQSCCAIERIYAHADVYDEVVTRLGEAAAGWRPGNPLADDTRLGPLAQESGRRTTARHVADAVARGARVVVGGNELEIGGAGRYFEATVLADADHEMAMMTEETFGPLAPVMKVASDEEAIARMNDSAYGLTASVWTRDTVAARQICSRLEAGTVFLNRCDYLDPALPWSGWKDSGVGITLSRFGFDRMVRTRAYHLRASP